MFTKVPEAKIVQYLRLLFRYRASNADIRSPILTRTIAPYYNRRCSNFFLPPPSRSSALSSSSSSPCSDIPARFLRVTFSTTFNIENFYLFYSKFFIFHQLNDSNCLNESSIVKSAFLKENGSPRLPTRFLRIASGNERNIRVPKSARLIITTLEILSLNERRPSHFTRRQRSRGESVEGGPVTEVECLHSSRAPSPQGWDILPRGL